ncbi:Adenosine receptor A2b [Trichoplax sp. H2]|nr:Adenosine receptor A2b [Trichoplax sp. H2]|eukprot:RDD39410.1 Adenosine receptor A2b [Trichoplax sp. H2]
MLVNQTTFSTIEYSHAPRWNSLTFSLINVTLGGLSILTNVIILVFIACDRKLRHISSNTALSSLLIVGAAFGVYLITCYGWFFSHTTYRYPSCAIFIVLSQSLMLNYNLHMILISADKYLRVAYPIRYPYLITTKKLTVAIILLWILAFTVVGSIYANILSDQICFIHRSANTAVLATFLLVIIIFLPLLCIIILYIAIMCLVYSRAKLVITIMPHVKQANLKRNKKAIQQMAIIIGIFSFCWLPYTISYMVQLGNPSFVSVDILNTLKVLLYAHITINPIIYYFYTLSLRREGGRIWRRSIRRVRIISRVKPTKVQSIK